MHEFRIFSFDEDKNEDVIFINTTEDLYFVQDSIFNELSISKGSNFTVLVDLFLRNGFSFNRFVELNFDGNGKCKSFVVNPRDVSDTIKSTINYYLKSNIQLLKDSALTQSIKDFVISRP